MNQILLSPLLFFRHFLSFFFRKVAGIFDALEINTHANLFDIFIIRLFHTGVEFIYKNIQEK